jgi:hypothetical protein
MTCLRVRLLHNASLHTVTLRLDAIFGLKLDVTIWIIQGHLCVSRTELGMGEEFTGEAISSSSDMHAHFAHITLLLRQFALTGLSAWTARVNHNAL